MFKVEIKNLSIKANIGITAKERLKKQLLKVTLSFNYFVNSSLNLNNIENVKDYSSITKYLKEKIKNSNSHTLEHLIIKISKEGKKIPVSFANRYYNKVGIGIDFTARDIQTNAKNKGLPWTLAKGFNHSAPISEFLSIEKFKDIQNINFSLKKK